MSKLYDGIMGLVVGDALGVPFEFQKRDTFKASDMVGYGTYNQPAGTWSDDSSMTLATLESIARLGRISPDDIMHNFYKWLFFAEFTPHGKTFDVGNTTRNAIEKFRLGVDPLMCGGTDVMDNGNGSLMRILPLAFINHDINDIYNVSSLTHAHNISKLACEFYIDIIQALIAGEKKEAAVKEIFFYTLPDEFRRLHYIQDLSRGEIKSTGYVVDTLEAALWCFMTTDSFEKCVLTAVNLGGDTDTIAAVAGGLAGVFYGVGGEKGIPEEWISKIAKHESIKQLCDIVESGAGS